jgi:hypothetical protein
MQQPPQVSELHSATLFAHAWCGASQTWKPRAVQFWHASPPPPHCVVTVPV